MTGGLVCRLNFADIARAIGLPALGAGVHSLLHSRDDWLCRLGEKPYLRPGTPASKTSGILDRTYADFVSPASAAFAREGVALYLMNLSGEAFAVIGEAVEINHRRWALGIRQRQFAAVLDPRKRLEIARKIVSVKLLALRLHPADTAAFRTEIAGARTILDLMAAEARAGGAYFMQYRGTELRIRGDTVPDHWRMFIVRAAPALKGLIGTSKARNAATPFGAMLNYVFAVALGQCTRAIIGAGMDPCFGFLHVPRQGRLSFSYDILEFHRVNLTSAVFSHAAKTSFPWHAFAQSPEGVVSLGPAVARDMAACADFDAQRKAGLSQDHLRKFLQGL
jgi:CRISPR-associated endonuclease Cas1